MASTVISQWIDDGTGEGTYRSELEVDYQQLSFLTLYNPDEVPPPLNIYIGETRLVEGIESQILADPKYGSGTILTTPEIEGDVPKPEKFAAIRECLFAKGMAVADVNQAIGETVNNNTLWEIKQSLIAWLRTNQ